MTDRQTRHYQDELHAAAKRVVNDVPTERFVLVNADAFDALRRVVNGDAP